MSLVDEIHDLSDFLEQSSQDMFSLHTARFITQARRRGVKAAAPKFLPPKTSLTLPKCVWQRTSYYHTVS